MELLFAGGDSFSDRSCNGVTTSFIVRPTRAVVLCVQSLAGRLSSMEQLLTPAIVNFEQRNRNNGKKKSDPGR
jgi:hypothetical protein